MPAVVPISGKKPSQKKTKKLIKEVPYNVTGWPEGTSLMLTDYINYDADTSDLQPASLVMKLRAINNSDSAGSPTKVLIGISTSPGNKELRQAIRETWGSSCQELTWCSYLFILGQSSARNAIAGADENLRVEEEHLTYRDILREQFVDSYNNLTLKSVNLLKHFLMEDKISGYARVQYDYLLKTDDDCFINMVGLKKLVDQRAADGSPDEKTIHGFLQHNKGKRMRVIRPNSAMLKDKRLKKWAMPRYMYKSNFYPDFISGGSGYLVNRKVGRCLLDQTQLVPLLFVEDVYITGLCAENCGIKRIHHKGFVARKQKRLKLQRDDVAIHYLTDTQIRQLYDIRFER